MDKFATLEPTKLYSNSTQHHRSPSFPTATRSTPTSVLAATKPIPQQIGKLPADLHVLVLAHLPVPDIARYARASRATSRVARDERVWERRWLDLAAQRLGLAAILDDLEASAKAEHDKHNGSAHGPATLAVSSLDDDFGDFASAPPALVDWSTSASTVDTYQPGKPTPTFRAKYVRAHTLLRPLLPAPNAPPHAVLASLSSSYSESPLLTQARVLHLLARFLSPAIKPVSTWDLRLASLKASLDRFDASLLTAFDAADTASDEARMKEVASASWEVSICMNGIGRRTNKLGASAEWEMGRLWAEKREVFYEQGQWDPSANFTCVLSLLSFGLAVDRCVERIIVSILRPWMGSCPVCLQPSTRMARGRLGCFHASPACCLRLQRELPAMWYVGTLHGYTLLTYFVLDAHIPFVSLLVHVIFDILHSVLGPKVVRIHFRLARARAYDQHTPLPVRNCRMLSRGFQSCRQRPHRFWKHQQRTPQRVRRDQGRASRGCHVRIYSLLRYTHSSLDIVTKCSNPTWTTISTTKWTNSNAPLK